MKEDQAVCGRRPGRPARVPPVQGRDVGGGGHLTHVRGLTAAAARKEGVQCGPEEVSTALRKGRTA